MATKETNNYEKIVSDILTNHGIFMVQYHSIKQFVATRLVDYINYNFEKLLDVVDYNEKTLDNSFVQADKVLKMKHIDLATGIVDRNMEAMPYAVDFIFSVCGEFLNDQLIRVKLGEITETKVTFQVEAVMDKTIYNKKREGERYPKLMTERLMEYTGDGPFKRSMEIVFEEKKLFSQLRTFSEVVNYTIHLIDTVQNRYKDLCKQCME